MTCPHTQGPWEFLEAGRTETPENRGAPLTISSPDGDDVASIYSADDATVCTPRTEAIANAWLIAAAPDLLALARKYASTCSGCDGFGNSKLSGLHPMPCEDCADIWAVIAKAEGRS